jgi:hypothetical protein
VSKAYHLEWTKGISQFQKRTVVTVGTTERAVFIFGRVINLHTLEKTSLSSQVGIF